MSFGFNWAVVVCAAAAAAILYVLAGYPLLLAWLAGRRTRPLARPGFTPTVSVILPVRNGAPWLAAKIESLLEQDYPRELVDILVVSDASTDETESIAARFAGRGVRLERLPRGGKAAALNHAIPGASGEILLLTDVRQRLNPECLRLLAGHFADPAVGAVSGDLVILAGKSSGEANTGLYWRYESWIRSNLSRMDSLLGATGPVYALRRSLAAPLPEGTLLDDVYLPMAALRQGYRLLLEPAAKAYDYPTSLSSEFGRKVRTQAGIYQLFRIAPWMFTPANRMWFHFVSLKLGRLFLPFFLLTILLVTPWLPSGWRLVAAAGQGAIYGLAAADGWIGEGNPLKRITAPLRAFTVLILAALRAVSIFFADPRSLWKETKVGPAANR